MKRINSFYNWLLSDNKRKFLKNNLAKVCLIFCILISAYLNSRAFTLGYIVAFVLLVAIYNDQQLITTKMKIYLFLTGLVFLILAIYIKSDSSLGRLLIYKISFTMFKEHWFNGVGLGKFKLNYLYYQAAYFKQGNFTQKELLLADNTQYAFNDYWQFILETGIKGIIIIITAIWWFTNISSRALKIKKTQSTFLLLAIAQLLALGLAALFTHVVEHFLFQCIFIIAIFVVAFYAYTLRFKLYYITLVSLLAIIYINYGDYILNYKSYQKLKDAEDLEQAGFIQESLIQYQQLYLTLANDPTYLVEYAKILLACEHFSTAENIIKTALTKQVHSDICSLLAQCYFKNKKFNDAEQTFLTAIYMVPNRFNPRYKLFQFYKKNGQFNKAMQVGETIIKLPIKVPSLAIDQIRKDVEQEVLNSSKF